MIETVLAGAVLFLCGALLLRMALPDTRRQRLDRQLRRSWERARLVFNEVPRHYLRRRRTDREAHEVIERARRRAAGAHDVEREGNVYRPDRFRPPTERDKRH